MLRDEDDDNEDNDKDDAKDNAEDDAEDNEEEEEDGDVRNRDDRLDGKSNNSLFTLINN